MNQGQKRVLGTGAIKPLVFFLGESPGRLGADQTGIPFTQDRSGKLLRKLLEEMGLSSHEIYISNVVKCNPRNAQGRNRRPSNEEIANCRKYLQAELKVVKARVIVPLGEVAAREFVDRKLPMSKINAKKFDHVTYGTIFPLYHPGYVIRGNYPLSIYRKDFACLRALVRRH
jgi:DNA polymerase